VSNEILSSAMTAQLQFGLPEMAGILRALPDPVFVLTRSGRYAAVLGGADARYYHDGTCLVGRSLSDVLNEEKARWFGEQVDQALQTGRLHVVEYCLGAPDVDGLLDAGPQGPIWFEGRIQALALPVNGEPAVLWVASNITERHRLEERLRQLSETDELCALANRRKLMRMLAERFDEFARYATPTAVLSLDIDNFKAINDQLGHEAGDRAIVLAAQACMAALRANDLAARPGGDEFVVIMPHTSMETAAQIADRLRHEIGLALLALRPAGLGTTISCGVSEFKSGDGSIDDVLRRADQALYRAKTGGRNRVELDRGCGPA
jgi:two-component system, cell cycle response regulator